MACVWLLADVVVIGAAIGAVIGAAITAAEPRQTRPKTIALKDIFFIGITPYRK